MLLKTRASLVALAMAIAITACGSDAGTEVSETEVSETEVSETETDASGPVTADTIETVETEPPSPTSGPADVANWPVTIDHRFGRTIIDDRPARIVSLDTHWTDVLLALDAPLTAAVLDPSAGDIRFPWQMAIPASVEAIPYGDQLPYEAIAALQPDLIVIAYFLQSEADYETLAQIAPTIPLLSDEQVDSWQDIATAAGSILGEQQAADALIREAEQRNADLLAELPGLEGRTYALANYVPGDAMYIVADPDDGSARFFAEIGLQIDPDLLAIADGATGRVKLSLESIEELDADLLIMLTNGADPDDIPGYALLPAVQSGAVALLDVATVTALNTPSPLSIPYVIGIIRPALEATAAAG